VSAPFAEEIAILQPVSGHGQSPKKRMNEKILEERLKQIVRSSAQVMELLTAVRGLNLKSWCIGAGVVRSLVWDHLHGFNAPSEYDDVDVAYFDNTASERPDAELTQRLKEAYPSANWEVTNQARVHEWFLEAHAQIVPPIRSLAEGVATWPEYATCVGVSLGEDESIHVVAPYGLEDLFALKVRHNNIRASAAIFEKRIASKRFIERWPMLSVISA